MTKNTIEDARKILEAEKKVLENKISNLESNDKNVIDYLKAKNEYKVILGKINSHSEYEGRYLKIVHYNDDTTYFLHCRSAYSHYIHGEVIKIQPNEKKYVDNGIPIYHQENVSYYRPNGNIYSYPMKCVEEITEKEFNDIKKQFKYKVEITDNLKHFLEPNDVYYVKNKF